MQESEADLIDGILNLLAEKNEQVRFLEIGVFSGDTARGIVRRCAEINLPLFAAGVDFEQWRPNPTPSPEYRFYAGDSMDAWRGITEKFNFLFIDGCHCVNHAMCDFLNYSPLVSVGGYVLFHDTALPLGKSKQDSFPQNHSYAGQSDSSLGVREALDKLGLIHGRRTDWTLVREIPSDSGIMGMCLFQKLA